MELRSAYTALSGPKKAAIIAGGLICLYAIIGFFVIPPVLRSQLEVRLAEHLGRKVTVEEVKMNPLALSLTVRGFDVKGVGGDSFVGFEELYVNFQLSSLFRQAYTFHAIHLTAPHGLVKILPDGSPNFADLMGSPDAPATPPDENSDVPSVLVFDLKINRGRFVFSDLSRPNPFEATFSPMHIQLEEFSTGKDDKSPYAFTATTGKGESLSWEGTFSVNPLRSEGRFALKDIKTRTLWDYVQHQVGFEVVDGSMHLASDYYVDASGDTIDFKITEGKFTLEGLQVTEKERGAPLISLPRFSVEGIHIDLGKKDAVVESIKSGGARFDGWLESDGVFNYAKLFKTDQKNEPMGQEATLKEEADASNAETSEAETKAADTEWTVTIEDFVLDDYSIHLENRMFSPPVRVNLSALGLHLKQLSTKPKNQTEMALNLRLNKTGTVKAEGFVTIDPVSAEVKIDADALPLKPFQSYIHSVSKLDLLSGSVNVNGNVFYQSLGEDGPEMRYKGSLGIVNFEGLNQSYTEDFLKWQALEFKGVVFDVAPNKLHISEIATKEPYARVMIWPDGSINIKDVFTPPRVKETEEAVFPVERPIKAVESKAQDPMPIVIDNVRVENGSANFADFSMKPNFFTGIQELNGTISGLSSDPSARADVLINGKIDRYAVAKIAGQINPLSPKAYVDMAVSFHNMELTPMTPYSGKFLGYTVEKGKLSVDLKYRLSDNALVGENVVVLNQFSLGESVDSPDATKLPVRLALALMKDRHGNIDIDLPVRGNLDDPEFSYGHLIVKALVNVITKIITSPFSLLASLVGGDGEELSFVEFDYGSAELLPHQLSKLDKLAQALEERPALQLQIKGAADQEYDRKALAEQKLMKELKLRKLQELGTASEEAAAKPEQVPLTQEEFVRFLTQKYLETYGHHPFTVTEEKTPDSEVVPPVAHVKEPHAPQMEPQIDPQIDPMMRMAMAKERLIKETPLDDAVLQNLARKRAAAIMGYLMQNGGIASERIFMLEIEVDGKDMPDGSTVRTGLSLSGM